MMIQVDGRPMWVSDTDIIRSVIIPGKLVNLLTQEPKEIFVVEQTDGIKSPIRKIKNPRYAKAD